MKNISLAFLLLFFVPTIATAETKAKKGLLPEVRLDSPNEDVNELKAATSEVLITRSENKAIESLQNILKTKKGSLQEADLLYRLAEILEGTRCRLFRRQTFAYFPGQTR